jgi:hypothetical protein
MITRTGGATSTELVGLTNTGGTRMVNSIDSALSLV